MHTFSRTVLPAYYLSPNMKTNSSNTLLYTSNSFNLRWRNISAIYRFLVLRSVIFLFPIAGPSLPGLAWPPACLLAGPPAHLSSQPADCQSSQAALKITRIQKYLLLYKNSLLCRTAVVSAYHIPPLKKILWKLCMWFFFLWNDMKIIWWNDNNKKDGYLWKENMNIANFASVRNSMVPNLNLLSKPYYISCKKNQAQFNEKKMSTKCRILKTNFDCKKKILCNRFAVSMRHKKVVKSNQLILPDQFFSIAKINLAFLDSHWRYSNKEDW